MTKVMRWGVMGNALIARNQVAPAIQLAEHCALVAVATRSATAPEFAARYPEITVHQGYEALLKDSNVDAIYIPLPNDMHIEWTLKCLAAGKHVLCEKPIALLASQIDDVIAARDKSGLLAAEAFMVVHHPQWRRIRELVQGGAIGKLRHVQGVFTYNNSGDPSNIRQKPGHGGGALLDIGVYPSVTTRFVSGQEPLELRARITRENGVDTVARVQGDFDGFSCDFYCSMRMNRLQEMLFHGEDGYIRVKAPFNPISEGPSEIQIRDSEANDRVEYFYRAMQYKLMIEAFRRAAFEGEAFACPLEFSRGNQAMIDAIFAADPA